MAISECNSRNFYRVKSVAERESEFNSKLCKSQVNFETHECTNNDKIFTDPCSMTSWMAVRSMSDILSNSSMQTTPRSAKTMAPASNRRSPDSGSVVTAAVKPTPDEPRP